MFGTSYMALCICPFTSLYYIIIHFNAKCISPKGSVFCLPLRFCINLFSTLQYTCYVISPSFLLFCMSSGAFLMVHCRIVFDKALTFEHPTCPHYFSFYFFSQDNKNLFVGPIIASIIFFRISPILT